MLKDADAVATIAVKDPDRARKFYEDILGFAPGDEETGVAVYRSGKASLLIYESEYAGTNRATSATWIVPDAEPVVAALREKGVQFEHYDLRGLPPTTSRAPVLRRGSRFGASRCRSRLPVSSGPARDRSSPFAQ